MANDKRSGGVTMGNISGGIHGSVIAGRDVSNATVTIGGQPIPVDKAPTVDELKQLLAEVRRELAEISTQKEALKEVSPATPFTIQGTEQSIKDAADRLAPEMQPEQAESVQKRLTEATSLISSILERAKMVAEKAGEVSNAVQPLVERLAPLVEKLGVAALWVAKLWLQS